MGKFQFEVGIFLYYVREILIFLDVLMVCDYARECSYSKNIYTTVFDSEGS